MPLRFPFLLLAATLLGPPAAPALTVMPVEGTYPQPQVDQAFDQTHPLFARVLREHVTGDARVHYRKLKAKRGDLDAYLDEISAVRAAAFASWSESNQLALLLNLYNAATLQLVVDHYPVKSIRKIGGPFKGPWKQPVVRLFGNVLTLDTLEHAILRTQFREPRLHFAIVCAAKGCPPLRAEPYAGARLSAQLDDQGRRFLGDITKNHVDAKALHLSPIFKWFEEDFTVGNLSVIDFVRTYFPAEAALEIRADHAIRYSRYDWDLNAAD